MRQFVYCLRFQGQASAAEKGDTTLRTSGRAPSCQVRTIIDRYGIESKLEPLPGEDAVFESEVELEADGTFLESGTISFGSAHTLHFSTVGRGHLEGSSKPGLKHGSVTWRIDRGEGQFDGAKGLITSNFLISDRGKVTDNQFGLIFLQ